MPLTSAFLKDLRKAPLRDHSQNVIVGAPICKAALLQRVGITKQTPIHDVSGIVLSKGIESKGKSYSRTTQEMK